MSARYDVIPVSSRRGEGGTRSWWEVCEIGPMGGVRRVIARTPVLLMRDAAAADALRRARGEALAMAAGLEAAAQAHDAAAERLRQVTLGPERGR